MSHPQAFHTSCRNGLAAHPGFQFNAASPTLDPALLSRLASGHAGYHVPRDMPLEPGPDDLARFPVALKVSPVDGVGAVVSRTVYVGREFRGRDGTPDEGRFGNYFTHIVVGNEREAFDGLLGIELWDAPHWTATESTQPVLTELGRLQPGPLDPERAARLLATAPRGHLAAVLDAALAALDGGPRVVLVDGDTNRSAAWIGWVSYALPAEQAQRLTFTTFDGRPRYADDVHVCVTTPACDLAFASHELGNSVRLLDVGGAAPPQRPSLYARVALALAEREPDALATAVRGVPAAADGARRGAWLAIRGSLTELVEGDELPAVLDLLCELARTGQVALAAEAAKELPADAADDRAALAEWAALHRVARERPADDDSRSLAASALARIVAFIGELPDSVAAVPSNTPTQPAVSNLAPWLSAVEAHAGTPACGRLLGDGLTLGLVGVNVAVDRRLSRAIAASLAHDSIRAPLRTIGRRPELEHIVVAVTEAVADRAAGSAEPREQLRDLATHAAARATLRRRAEEQRTFERLSMWLQAEVAADPSRRRSAAADLATLATTDRDDADIRLLWGEAGPRTESDYVELLGAYLSAGAQPPVADVNRALEALMRLPLDKARPTDALAATLGRCQESTREHPSYRAWWVATTKPGAPYAFAEWAGNAGKAIAADPVYLPEPRWQELCPYVCGHVLRQRRAPDYAQGIAALRSRAGEEVDRWLEVTLEEMLKKERDDDERLRLIAELYMAWRGLPQDGPPLVDEVLMRATESVKRRDLDDVVAFLPPALHDEWGAWQESRPRSTVARAFGRLGRRSKDEAQQ
jgi:hypothetical protein